MTVETSKETLIKLENVSCYYNTFLAVKNVNLGIEANKIQL